MSIKSTLFRRILCASLCTIMTVPVMGASLSVSAATAGQTVLSAETDTETPLKNTSDIEWDGISLGESVTINCSAKGGTGKKQFAVFYKGSSDTAWKTLSAYSAKDTVTFTPSEAGLYTVRVRVKDESGTTKAKDFDLCVNQTVNADFLREHKVGITGTFCGWGFGDDEYIPDVEMTDDDGDGVWEGVVNIDNVTEDMIEELITEDEDFNRVGTGIYGIQCKIRLDDEWNYSWASYESMYDRTENSQTNLCIPATAGDSLSFRVFLDTNQVMSDDYDPDEEDAYYVWKTGIEAVSNVPLKNTSDIKWNGISLGESVTINCSAKGGTGKKQFAVFYKGSSDTAWKTLSAYSTKDTVTFTPTEAGLYTVRVRVKDESGATKAKDFNLCVNQTVNADFLREHKVGITGTFCGWGFGDDSEYIPDVEMTDDDGDGVWEGVVNIDNVTEDMIEELITTDEDYNTVATGVYGIQCKIRLDDEWNYLWASYESMYDRTENSQTNLCIPATAGDSLSFRVFLDTNQVMSDDYDPDEEDAYYVWKTGIEAVSNVPLKNTSDIKWNGISLGESVTINCSAKGGTGKKQFAVFYKGSSDTAWKTLSAYSTKDTVTFTPTEAGLYTVRVRVKDESGATKAKDFNLCVNQTVNADFLREHKVGITGTFCGWGFGDDSEYIPDVEMTDDDGDGVWEGVVNIDNVTEDMIEELITTDEDYNTVATGVYGIQCKIRLDDEWNYLWASYESMYDRTENSQTNLCIPATAGESLSFRVFLDTNQVMSDDYDPTDSDAYMVWRTGVKDIHSTKNPESLNMSVGSIRQMNTIWDGNFLGDPQTYECDCDEGTGVKQFAMSYKKPGQTNWKTLYPFSTKNTFKFNPKEEGFYFIRFQVKDETGRTGEFSHTVEFVDKKGLSANQTVLAYLKSHKPEIYGSFDGTVEMNDNDGDGVWKGTVTIDKVTKDMIQGSGNNSGMFGVCCRIYVNSEYSHGYISWGDYSPYGTRSSAIDLCVPATVGQPLSFRVTLNTNRVVLSGIPVDDEYANIAWRTGVEVIYPFKNTSSISTKSMELGNMANIYARAVGAEGSKQYKVLYRELNEENWKTLSDYTSKTYHSFSPKKAGTYIVRVKVKDQNGSVAVKDMKIIVYNPLKNLSEISSKNITLGDEVYITGSAQGGKGDYLYAVYYKKASSSTWTKGRGFEWCENLSITPKAAVKYDIRVIVKDKTGKFVSKYFTINVTK